MNSLVILANGLFPKCEKVRQLLWDAKIVISCDGAAEALFAFGRVPDAIIGDLDSISEEILAKYPTIIQKDHDQETNDLTKAFKLSLSYIEKNGIDKVHILGATGLREDHALGNISLLADYIDSCPCPIDMISDYGRMVAINDSCSLEGVSGQSVSIFAFDNSLNIISEGLKYPTENVVFDTLWKATLNRVEKSPFRLNLSHPAKVIIYFAN